MTRCDLDKVHSGSTAERAEVIAAIDGLVEEVANLALLVKRIVAMADAANAKRAQDVDAGVARHVTGEQAELNSTPASTESDVQAVEMAEASHFPLSPQHDSYTGNVGSEIDFIDDLKRKLEAAFAQPRDASCR